MQKRESLVKKREFSVCKLKLFFMVGGCFFLDILFEISGRYRLSEILHFTNFPHSCACDSIDVDDARKKKKKKKISFCFSTPRTFFFETMMSTSLCQQSGSLSGSRLQQRSMKSAASRRVARASVKVRAAEFDADELAKKYEEVSNKIPPILTTATIPIVGVSLLSKTFTGHGLPGTFLGALEGVSWLVLPLGFGSLYPRLADIFNEGSYEPAKMLEMLTKERTYEKYGADSRGKNATERVANISGKVDQNSPLAEQMADLRKQEEELAKETPEEKAAREKLRAELAASAIGMANSKSKSDEAEADKKGRDSLLSQPVTQTLKENMTVENYDVDVTKFDDKALGSTLNLSATDVEKGAPKLNKGDKWKEQYRTEENSAGKSED
tara:strand:- start:5 stop:1153 length:1149 start_codon:yes stop_codon:yes gene_type:complete